MFSNSLIAFVVSFCVVLNRVSCECNYGVYDYTYPLAEGECSVCNSGCDNFESMSVECSDGSATLVYYEDSNCTTEYTSTSLSRGYYKCSNSGSCSTTLLTIEEYNGNDCSGDEVDSFTFVIAQVDFCVNVFLLSADYSYKANKVDVDTYLGLNCSDGGVLLASGTLRDTCDNRTRYDFDFASKPVYSFTLIIGVITGILLY